MGRHPEEGLTRLLDHLTFRTALEAVARLDRDAWLNRALDLPPPPEDTDELPRGCVPYLPCPVGALLHIVDTVGPVASILDVGSGAGRSAVALHLLTGADVIGIEIQTPLVTSARILAAPFPRIQFIAGDVLTAPLPQSDSIFLYCPFGGERLATFLDRLPRPTQIACVDLELPPRHWLDPLPSPSSDVALYRAR